MKTCYFLLLLLFATCFWGCKKDKDAGVDDRCHLPFSSIPDFDGRFTCGGGGGVYPNYFCGPALAGHENKLVVDKTNNTLYLNESPGNIKGVVMDMGAIDCAFINNGVWSKPITDKVVPYVNGHCYVGLFPDGDTIRFYIESDVISKEIGLRLICDTALVPVHDSLFIGRYYNENDGWAGVIAYILQPGDPGYDPAIKHGLLAAPADISGEYMSDVPWSKTDAITGATDSVLGSGRNNTDLIISVLGVEYYAAYKCKTFAPPSSSGYYLPSLHELQKLYNSRNLIGGFKEYGSDFYWSSTEIDNQTAYSYSFFYGLAGENWKTLEGNIRAVKSF